MNVIEEKILEGERALYGEEGLVVKSCVFQNGESPIKECANLELDNCLFKWKYPIWYSKNISIKNTTWDKMGRAGVWYVDDIKVSDSYIYAPKNFRRCNNVELTNVDFKDAEETLWSCNNVKMNNVTAVNGDYICMNSSNMEIDGFNLEGNYSFDGARNVVIRNSRLMSKDAFWNSENVTVYDSYICGEYLGWNSKNLTLINCEIESLQGMCYIQNLVMKNCRLNNTNLAFEFVHGDVEIEGSVDSVMNPLSGVIKADSIGELIIEKELVDESKLKIICKDIKKRSDKPEWKRTR